LNYIGVVIACLSGVVFFAVRPVKQKEIIKDQDGNEPFIESSQGATIKTVNGTSVEKAPVTIVKTVSIQQRIVGAILAIITGAIFGLVFNPSTYIQDHLHKYPGATKNGLHYVYAMYSGILISSIFYYVVYIAYKRNHPYLCIQSILPAIISGMMWGVAQAGFLVANSVLSQAISFPLIMIGPGTIATLWSIFYFKEITGIRNYLIIIAGTILRIIAAVLIVLSKPVIKD
jgi:glucose uptake protein GlcU